MGDIESQSLEIPHLVLFRNGQLTPVEERRLTIDIQGLDLPPAGLTANLLLETQHTSPSTENGEWTRTVVLSNTLAIRNTWGVTQTSGTSIRVSFEFSGTIPSSTGPVLTPTDYYRLTLRLTETGQETNTTNISREYAFLLENQWIIQLPQLLESAPGAAPHRLVIYYCDMFLSWIDESVPPMTRQGVNTLIQDELIPQFTEGFLVETNQWGFPWHLEWTSYRADEEPQTMSIALSDGCTWYHGVSSGIGNAAISIMLVGEVENLSDTLLEGMLNTYYHELFHNLQRNILQHQFGEKEIRGKSLAWPYFTEGMANMASSVGQPSLEFSSMSLRRGYLFYANLYFSSYTPGINMNRSLRELEPRFSSLYWRFLYEHCGGMSQGVEDPAAGMQIIRQVLETLYSGEVVDTSATDDLVAYFPAVMDKALSTSTCPFHTFAWSWNHFAHALYSLHLQDGRCIAPGVPGACELYDPNGMYREPPVAEIPYAGNEVVFGEKDQGPFPGIQNSFGMDFVEIRLAPESAGQPLKIELLGAPDSPARFNLQVLLLNDDSSGLPSNQVSEQPVFSGEWDGMAEPLAFTIPNLDLQAYNRLGLIITRLDNREVDDPVGAYTLRLHP